MARTSNGLSPINRLIASMASKDISMQRLQAMDLDKTAKHYGLPVEWIEHYRNAEITWRQK